MNHIIGNITKQISNIFSKKRVIDSSQIIVEEGESEYKESEYEDNEDCRIYISPCKLKQVFVSKEEDQNYDFYCKNVSENLKNVSSNQTINSLNTKKRNSILPLRTTQGWKPPEQSGLLNSNQIIPTYYFTENNKENGLLKMSYYHIIIDDIRNMRKLNDYQIEYTLKLEDDMKQEIIKELIKANDAKIDYIELIKSKANSVASSFRHELSSNFSSNFEIKELLNDESVTS